MTIQTAEKLFKEEVSVIGKLNSFDPLVQDHLTDKIGSHEQMMLGLRNLIKAGFNKTRPTRLGVESVVCMQNYNDIPKIWAWCRERNIFPFIELLNVRGRALMHDLEPGREEIRRLWNSLLEIDQKKYGYTWIPTPPYAGFHCRKHYYGLYVDSQGYVHPCSGVHLPLGNIRQTTLKDILGLKIFKRIRNMRKNLKGKCMRCKNNTFCYGCRGYAMSTSGDMFAEDGRCLR